MALSVVCDRSLFASRERHAGRILASARAYCPRRVHDSRVVGGHRSAWTPPAVHHATAAHNATALVRRRPLFSSRRLQPLPSRSMMRGSIRLCALLGSESGGLECGARKRSERQKTSGACACLDDWSPQACPLVPQQSRAALASRLAAKLAEERSASNEREGQSGHDGGRREEIGSARGPLGIARSGAEPGAHTDAQQAKRRKPSLLRHGGSRRWRHRRRVEQRSCGFSVVQLSVRTRRPSGKSE